MSMRSFPRAWGTDRPLGNGSALPGFDDPDPISPASCGSTPSETNASAIRDRGSAMAISAMIGVWHAESGPHAPCRVMSMASMGAGAAVEAAPASRYS